MVWKCFATMKSIGVLENGWNDIQGILECGTINSRNRGQETSSFSIFMCEWENLKWCFFHMIQYCTIFILIPRRKWRVRLCVFGSNLPLTPWDYTNITSLVHTNKKWPKVVASSRLLWFIYLMFSVWSCCIFIHVTSLVQSLFNLWNNIIFLLFRGSPVST